MSLTNADGFTLGGSPPCVTPGEACNNQLGAFATVRGRVGMPMKNNTLGYVTLGLAAGDVFATGDTGACGAGPGSCSYDDVRFGWTAGVGIEKPMANGWSLRGEYLYMDFGSAPMVGGVNEVRAEFHYGTLRVGATRRF